MLRDSETRWDLDSRWHEECDPSTGFALGVHRDGSCEPARDRRRAAATEAAPVHRIPAAIARVFSHRVDTHPPRASVEVRTTRTGSRQTLRHPPPRAPNVSWATVSRWAAPKIP
jgi:hypothetical protein